MLGPCGYGYTYLGDPCATLESGDGFIDILDNRRVLNSDDATRRDVIEWGCPEPMLSGHAEGCDVIINKAWFGWLSFRLWEVIDTEWLLVSFFKKKV